MNFFHLTKREFTRQDNSLNSNFFPEFYLCPVSVVGLNRKVNFCIWEIFSNQVDESRITHDVCIWFEGLHFFERFHERTDFHIVRINIGSEIDFFSARMGIFYAFCECIPRKLIFTRTKRKHWYTSIYCVRTICNCIFEFFEITRRHQEFQFFFHK